MFRCTECHAEYETKPDYCECSNDVFEEILPEVQPEQPQVKEIRKNEQIKQAVVQEVKPKKVKKQKPSAFDPVSTIIFTLCLILSFIVIFFVGNPEEEIETVEIKEEQTPLNIPNIDKIWDNTPPGYVQKQPEPVEQPQVTVVPVVQQPEPIKTAQQPKPQPKIQVQPTVKQQPTNKTTTKQVVKTTAQKAATVAKTQPKATTTTAKVAQTTQTQQPKSQATTVQAKPTTTQTAQTKPATTQQTAITPTVIPAPIPQATATVNKQELMNYKVSLRNKIASKINFANVIGDGSCVVTFSLSSSGTLKNTKFKTQSDNFTLNDVVHSAIMQTPSYNPPPNGYNGETMSLTVKMYNGNFEVSLK